MNKWRKIGNLITYSGKGITPRYVEDSTIIVLNQKCIRDHRIDYTFARFTDDTRKLNNNKFLKKGDVLFNSTGKGTAGRCAFVDWLPHDKRVITDSHILVLRFEDYYEALCLSYSFFSIESTIQSFMDGSTGQGELDKIRVFNLLTSLTEDSEVQQKISKFLSDLDAKIALNHQINAELEAMAKTLYDYWFVQFDFPDANGQPYKSSGGKMVYNEVLKREVPEGWEVKELGEFASFKNGKSISKTKLTAKGVYKVFGSNGIIGNANQVLFTKPVIAIGRVGANYGKVHFSIEPCWITDNAVTVQPQRDCYLWWLILTLKMINYNLISGGSAQPLITQGKVKKITTVHPSNKVMNHFYKIIDPFYQKRNLLEQENQHLTDLRDWLLPMLMNGQVVVGGDEEQLRMAAEQSVGYGKRNVKNKCEDV